MTVSSLTSILTGALLGVQATGLQIHPDDSLHRFAELEVDAGGADVEFTSDFEGTLHVWVSSDEIDPALHVQADGREVPLEDEGTGDGTTAWLAIEVGAAQVLAVRVFAETDESGKAALHLVAAPETEATRAAAEAGRARLGEVEALRAEGTPDALAEARERVARVVDELCATEGAGTSQRIATALWEAGQAAYRLSALEPASLAFAAVHAARVRTRSTDHPALLSAKEYLAVTRRGLGNLPDALALFEDVHAARARMLPDDHPQLLRAMENVAAVRGQLGDVAGAAELHEEVLAARERSLPEEDPDLLTAQLNVAATRARLGDLKGALELAEHVREVRERLLPEDDLELLVTRRYVAIARAQLGDLKGARELLERVHAASARLLPEDHPDLLGAKQNLAAARAQLGDLAGALALLDHVHAARERLLPADHPDLLRAKQGLAITRKQLGDLAGALELEETVLAAWERLLPPDHPDLLAAKLNLAGSLVELGELERAVVFFEQVHQAWDGTLPADHSDLLAAKLNLARMRYELGDLDGALELEEQVHAVRERLPEDHPGRLLARMNLATTRSALGDPAGALELAEGVVAAWERVLPEDHTDLLRAKEFVAVTQHELGDDAAAYESTRSLLASQLAVAERLRTAAPRVARAGAAAELQRLSSALFLTGAGGDEPDHAGDLLPQLFCVLESLRAVSTSSGEVARAAARFPELEGNRARLVAAGADLSSAVLSAPEGEIEAWRLHVVELTEQRDRLQRELLERLAARGLVFEAPTVQAVARGLDEDAGLVTFLRYERLLERGAQAAERAPRVPSLLAFVVTPDARIERVELGPVARIENVLSAWRSSLGRPVVGRGVGQVSGADDEQPGQGDVLRRLVLDPVLARFPEVRTLHVVPDDLLYLVPIEALPLDGVPLGERLVVRQEPTVLRLLRAPRALAGEARLVALGGVDYDAEVSPARASPVAAAAPPVAVQRGHGPARSAVLTEGFAPLGETAAEIRALGRAYRARFEREPSLLLGAGATKDALFEQAPGARWLHLATHGWFAPETVTSTIDAVERRGGVAGTLARAAGTVHGFAPQTLCGLALAGANRGMNELGRVPGIVTAEELATLDLSSCDLGVLSACETNVGIRRAGQGIQSLQTALHAAGARTAITSLWKVDDAATRRLFEIFYTKLWVEGLGKADALWQAKMALREEGHPTRDWAGWVLTGDPD